MSVYEKIRPWLFKMDTETAHNLAIKVLNFTSGSIYGDDILYRSGGFSSTRLESNVCGLNFYNPIGLAAGFDKNAKSVRALCALGFGFLELGTITKIAQSGNLKPRLFRHIEEESLQNCMGFNNIGSEAFAKRAKNFYPFVIPLGINIGKNKNIAQVDSCLNYQKALEDVLNIGDYYTFNLSSPNTPGLRDLQNEIFVKELFSMVKGKTNKPAFLKISPDMEIDDMLKVCEAAIKSGASGIIATNTTIDTSMIANPASGGISGKALQTKSKLVLKELGKAFFKQTTLISVGGIDSAKEAYERIRLGASLIQLYSAFIFQGPSICKNINQELDSMLISDGIDNIKDAVGVDL